MPTYGLRPDDLVRDSRGDVAIDLKQTFYATRPDAEMQVNPLGTATSAKDGKWQFTHTASGVFGRDPEGNIRFYDSEEPKLTEATASVTYAGQVPDRALRRWHSALADRANNPANIVFLGDSLAEGRAASTPDKGWATQATALLRSRFPVAGLTGQPSRNYIPTWYGWSTYNSAKEFSGVVSGVTQQSATGLGLRNYRQNAASTITVTVTGSAVDLVYAGSTTTGTFTYAVDGGAPVSVNTSQGVVTTTLTDGLKTRVTFGSAGSHTLSLVWVSSSVFLNGVIVYNGDETKGIRAFDAGHSGQKITDLTVTTNPPFEASVAAVSPSLVAISLGENDYTANVTAATSKANLQSVIARIKAAMPYSPSFVLMGWSRPMATATTYADTWENYLAMYREIAAGDPDNVTVFDVSKRIDAPGVTNGLGLWDADLQHLSTKGAALVADAFTGFIAPR